MSELNGHALLAPPDMNTATVYEQALVGILMEFQDELPKAITHGIVEAWFQDPAARLIWRTILDLNGRGEPFSPVDVASATHGSGLLSVAALERVLDLAPLCVAKIPHYAKKMRHAHAQRATGHVLRQAETQAMDETSPEALSGLLGAAAHQLIEISAEVLHEGAIDTATAARIAARECDQATHGIIGVRTGIGSLDFILGGMRPGEYIVLGARPSTGKTALAVTFAANLLHSDPDAVIFFASADMAPSEVLKRFFSVLSGTSAGTIERKQATPEQRDAWDEAVGQIAASQLRVEARGMHDPTQILAAATAHRNVSGRLDLVIVDHIHLLRPKAENRNQELTVASGILRQMIHDLEVPALILAQLNRGVTGRDNKRPSMADIRDSGSIEQDADIVMFVHRDGVYNHSADQTIAEIIVDKMRRGQTGTVQAHFNPETLRFTKSEREAPFHSPPKADKNWGHA